MFKRKSKQSSLDLNISLNGYFKPEYNFDNSQEAEKVLLDPTQDKAEDRMYTDGETPSIAMKDGRVLVDGPLTEESAAAIFHKKGFCLFPHPTKVETWNEEYIKGMVFGSDISRIYASELEAIIRNELLPDYHIISVDVPPAVLKRGPKSKNNFYGSGVHQDYALTLQDYKCSVDAYDPTGFAVPGFEKKYEDDEVRGFMMINFWRPIDGYTKEKPLLTKPLAVCDPASVETKDTVHTALDANLFHGKKGAKSDQMGLKYNSKHDWYYYPKMTDDEVLIFKQFEFWKDDDPVEKRESFPVRGVFHTAFDDPSTPDESPPRQSTECRVQVFVGKKRESPLTPEERFVPTVIPEPLSSKLFSWTLPF